MSLDYVSTAPWNDPYDPWPVYSKIQVTDTSGPTTNTYTLSVFEPLSPFLINYNGGVIFIPCHMLYVNDANANELLFYSSSSFTAGVSNYTKYWYNLDVTAAFRAIKNNTSKNNVYKSVTGQLNGWDGTRDMTDYTILPVLSSLAPWERRRIAGGTG